MIFDSIHRQCLAEMADSLIDASLGLRPDLEAPHPMAQADPAGYAVLLANVRALQCVLIRRGHVLACVAGEEHIHVFPPEQVFGLDGANRHEA